MSKSVSNACEPLRLAVNYRLGGMPRYSLFREGEDRMASLPEEVRHCVTFLCTEDKATGKFRPRGTAFLVSMEGTSYLVTAAHIIKNRIKEKLEKLHLRVNLMDGTSTYVSTSVADWV